MVVEGELLAQEKLTRDERDLLVVGPVKNDSRNLSWGLAGVVFHHASVPFRDRLDVVNAEELAVGDRVEDVKDVVSATFL